MRQFVFDAEYGWVCERIMEAHDTGMRTRYINRVPITTEHDGSFWLDEDDLRALLEEKKR